MVDFETDIKNCIRVLEAGGTILYPTDTVWGLGCNALDETAVDRIFAIKERERDKSLIVLLADAKEVIRFVAAPHPDIIDILESFRTPTTVVYDNALEFPGNLVHDDGSIAIRVVNDPFCKALIKRLRRPLVSTSANISGNPAPSSFSAVDPVIIGRVDYVVRHRQDEESARTPSRLVRIGEDGELEILRP
jgi:L-threonylcarbamoyladenylate synthase